MSKSNKAVNNAVAKSVNPSFAREILAQVDKVATKALDVQISTAVNTEEFQADFATLCLAAGVPVIKRDGVERFDRESEVGKALDAALRVKVTESAKGRAHYSVEVHRMGDDDKYLPVRMWSRLAKKWTPVEPALAVNHTFTAAFALGVDLKTLPSVAEKPNGVKAWMRGNAVGERPDGKGQGLRDWIKNDVDQALSRGWKTDASGRASGTKKDLADVLNALDSKTNRNKRANYEKDNGVGSVVSQDQWAALCSIMVEAAFDPALADEIIAAADRAGS
jgi:hypothetical protein